MKLETRRKFGGSLVALVTPMTEDGKIDFECLNSLVDWHIESGTDGIVTMGTTGESALLDESEYIAVVESTINRVAKRVPVIAGCGGISTAKTLDLAKKLNQLKPDGFLCVTPYYVKPSQAGLIAHFEALANVCAAPVILYNVPGRTGVDLTDESVYRLAQHDNIVGLKDATGNIERAKANFAQLENFDLLSGDDETAFDYISAGGDGAISVTANVAPRQMHQWIALVNKAESGEVLDEAKHIFDLLMPLHKTLFVEANPIPVKWALWKMNKIDNGIRLPLTLPSSESQKAIHDALSASNIIREVE